MRSIGWSHAAFGPRAVGLTAGTLPLLAERGDSYISPAGEREGTLDGLAVLPFRWQLVDAHASAAVRRAARALPRRSEPYGPEQTREETTAALHAHAQRKATLGCCSTPSRSPSPASRSASPTRCSRRQPASPPPARSRRRAWTRRLLGCSHAPRTSTTRHARRRHLDGAVRVKVARCHGERW